MDASEWLQERAEAAVRAGGDVRRNVAAAVAAAAQGTRSVAEGFTELLRATFAGAARAVGDALPDREGTLRQVVDGVGDGLAMAAHAAELTLREAGGGAARFARDEVDRIGRAFGDVPARFVAGITSAAVRAGGRTAGAADELATHAAVTLRRIRSPLAKAADALCQHPVGLAQDAASAGAAAARGAAGAFLEVMGRKLVAMGVVLAPRNDGES